ncbi:hypothetical protein THAOC_01609 [Thalassiosira oceanica]|uniref:Uncharacterized protein n=1 Tax=Thalassiosira oceanica TaxID=159749 RepID=K0THZ7_THAOC|nr:hypothetical protein THAOC_01609 [Thalassiosira oceanica]|eukprot:EJK76619.1 hypothetical protein THAOC_01609 [Thalassiosira oceanica]
MRHYHLAYQHSMAALSALSSKTTVADADDAAKALVDMKTNALVQTAFTDVGEVVAKTCSMMDENYIQNIQIGFAQPDNIIIETDDKTGIDAFDANDEVIRWNPESPPPPGRTPNQSPARPPTRLAVPQDAAHLNSLHQMVRQDLLELFVAPPNDDEDCAYYGGRVGLRCVHCSTIRRNKAARSAFFPNRLRTIYRDVSSWQQVSIDAKSGLAGYLLLRTQSFFSYRRNTSRHARTSRSQLETNMSISSNPTLPAERNGTGKRLPD